MRKNLIESAEGSNEYCIKIAAHNISLKDIKTPAYHFSNSKTDTNHAVKKPNFPQTPSCQLLETVKEERNHKKIDDGDARLGKQVKDK